MFKEFYIEHPNTHHLDSHIAWLLSCFLTLPEDITKYHERKGNYRVWAHHSSDPGSLVSKLTQGGSAGNTRAHQRKCAQGTVVTLRKESLKLGSWGRVEVPCSQGSGKEFWEGVGYAVTVVLPLRRSAWVKRTYTWGRHP